MTLLDVVVKAAQIVGAGAAGGFVFASYRAIARRSQVTGAIVATALITRAVLGVAMFWASFLSLPLARSLQAGGGFWNVALDATGYFQMAAVAHNAHHLVPLDHSVPAPLYVNVLTVWMGLVGVSPAAGMFLNLCLYTLLVLLLVRGFRPVDDWRRDLPCIVAVTAFSFAPVIVFHSTQPLKDDLTIVLIALASVAVLGLRRLLQGLSQRRDLSVAAAASVGFAVAVFGISGIRWYFGAMMLGSAAIALAIAAFAGRRTPLLRYVGATVMVLLLGLFGFRSGSGPFYGVVIGANLHRLLYLSMGTTDAASPWQRLMAIPHDLLTKAQLARTGFLLSGGSSNVVVPVNNDAVAGLKHQDALIDEQHRSAGYRERELALQQAQQAGLTIVGGPSMAPATPPVVATEQIAASAPPPVAADEQEVGSVVTPRAALAANDPARAIPVTKRQQIRTVLAGLAIMFLPVKAVGALMHVQITGGRGLLALADLDTVFLDVMTLTILTLLWTRRRTVPHGTVLLLFAVTLAGLTAVLLGYVVTNFGTLWRMRPMAITPLWMLPLLLSPSAVHSADGTASEQDVAAAATIERGPA